MNKEKIKKVTNIVVTALCAIIFIFAVFTLIISLTSRSKGYTSFFGHAYLTVESYSMNGGKDDSFTKGDLLKIKILSDDEKLALDAGKIISFWDTNIIKGQRAINTHRIIDKQTIDGKLIYQTKGDANENPDPWISTDDIIGVYESKAEGGAKFIIWLNSKTGNLICVVIPSILLVMYCIYLVAASAYNYNKKKLVLAKEEMKQELLKELSREKSDNQNNNDDNTGSTEK